MANDKNLAQVTNQEAILEEINEEELDEVVGGAILLGSIGRLLGTFIVRATDAADELVGGLLDFGPPA
ncbi:MAG: bacteriocin [Nostoc sp.]|uniref:bacteriocin n=1 Tax=Nostoc sp. TaxID=1180 RepID=UPI002FF4AF2F